MQNGTVEMCHTASYYYVGKDPTFALFCAVPFGLNTRQQNAWFYRRRRAEADRTSSARSSTSTVCSSGNTGAQMGGWFRKEIKEAADLNGLKMRIGGLAGKRCSKLGVVPQQIAGGDIYPALEKGTIDAAEWVGPYDDEKLGFHKVAQYYYYPGWWEGGTADHTSSTSTSGTSCRRATSRSCTAAAYAAQPRCRPRDTMHAIRPALKRLVAAGAQLRPFPQAGHGSLPEGRRTRSTPRPRRPTPDFKKIYENMIAAFRNDEYLWWQVAEYTYDTFMIRTRPRA